MLIEVVEAADKTTGGLLLTEGSKERPTMGKVRLPPACPLRRCAVPRARPAWAALPLPFASMGVRVRWLADGPAGRSKQAAVWRGKATGGGLRRPDPNGSSAAGRKQQPARSTTPAHADAAAATEVGVPCFAAR